MFCELNNFKWNSLELALLLLCFPPIFVELKLTLGSQPEMHVKPIIMIVCLQRAFKIYYYNTPVQCSAYNTARTISWGQSPNHIIYTLTIRLRGTHLCSVKLYRSFATLYVSFLQDKCCSDGARSFSNTCYYWVSGTAEKHWTMYVCTHHMRFSNTDKRNLCKFHKLV